MVRRFGRIGRRVVASFAAGAGFAMVIAPGSVAERGSVEWHSDRARWTGTGRMFLPGGGHVGVAPDDPAGCSGCRWAVVPVCGKAAPTCSGTPFTVCPPRSERFFILFSPRAGVPLTSVNEPCLGDGEEPVSEERLAAELREAVDARAPALRPSHQPSSTALTQLPTIFASNQPRQLRFDEVIAGLPTRLRAEARWRWRWGDGRALSTSVPGGKWPNMSLTHTYRRAGGVRVAVATTWHAEYWVGGAGPFPVPGAAVTQEASLDLPVREARAVLVS